MFFTKRKPKQFMITVPEPCNEDWNSMHAVDDIRRHCDSCAKQVVDFTQMSDTELMLFFRNNQNNVCGRFAAHQVQRPMPLILSAPKKQNGWRALLLLPFALFAKQTKAQSNDSVPSVDSTHIVTNDSIPVPEDTLREVAEVPETDSVVDSIVPPKPVRKPKKPSIDLLYAECQTVYGGSWVITGSMMPEYPTSPLPDDFFEALPFIPTVNRPDSDLLQTTPRGITDQDPLATNDPAPKPAIPPDSWYEAILPVAWRIKRKR